MKRLLVAPVLSGLVLLLSLWAVTRLWGDTLVTFYIEPSGPFVAAAAGAAPDYADTRSWAALPGKSSAALLSPGSGAQASSAGEVAVFFIHPTSFISGAAWNAPLQPGTRSWEMVDIILGAQASAFNLCCDIYAPHYRQATLWSFLDRQGAGGEAALELAYADIESAFDSFLARNSGRPFIIASHSQGTYHALRLLAERVDGTELQQSLIVAYLLGYWVPLDTFERTLTHILPCESATDTACVVHWSTYGERGARRQGVPHWYPEGVELADGKPLLCTNPLSWRRDGERVPATRHPGALYVSPGGSLLNSLLNTAAGVELESLPPLLRGWTWAECRDGLLRVADQEQGAFAEAAAGAAGDYHLLDYNLFYQAIRSNAVARARSYGLPLDAVSRDQSESASSAAELSLAPNQDCNLACAFCFTSSSICEATVASASASTPRSSLYPTRGAKSVIASSGAMK